MGNRLFVGNLGYGVTDSELAELFRPHGTVVSATVLMDRETKKSKGFGFVEMKSEVEAKKAGDAVNGLEVGGRILTVSEARPRPSPGERGRR